VTTRAKRGAKVNPDSKRGRARTILASLPEADCVSSKAVKMLVDQLGISNEVAKVYFYTQRPKRQNVDNA
jgi:hypothetical protein